MSTISSIISPCIMKWDNPLKIHKKLVFHFGCIFLYILHVVHIVDGMVMDVCVFMMWKQLCSIFFF